MDRAFVRVRKWLTPMDRRMIFPCFVIFTRFESDLLIDIGSMDVRILQEACLCKPCRGAWGRYFFAIWTLMP